jgi:hypothetical protein
MLLCRFNLNSYVLKNPSIYFPAVPEYGGWAKPLRHLINKCF